MVRALATDRLVTLSDPASPELAPFTAMRERDLVGREGLFVAEGEVVVRVLVSQSRLPIRALLLERRRLSGMQDVVDALAERAPDARVLVVDQAVMDEVVGFSIHRGILALGAREPAIDPETLRARVAAAHRVVGLVGLTNHDNVGGIFRNAAAFDADLVLLDEATCDPLYRKAIRVSAGAALTVPFARVASGEAMLDLLASANVPAYALSPAGDEDVSALANADRACLLLGTEGPGLPEAILARARRLRIDMRPGFDSLNVAVASGIALHEARRSRR